MDVEMESVEPSNKRKSSTQEAEVVAISPDAKQKAFTSAVWEHYERVMDGKKLLHSLCLYCRKKYGAGCATSTLTNHLSKCPKYPYNQFEKKQKTLEILKEGENKLVSWKFDPVLAREAICKMIVMDELPFSFIERAGFQQFVKVVQPRLQLVCRNTIAKDCMNLYNKLKSDLKSKLALHAHRICLTTDIWTSLQNLSYMVLTSHFIDKEWVLQKRVLSFSVISSHKGIAICGAIEACLLDWGIDKVFTLTVDNASANDTAIDHLKKKLMRKDGLILEGESFQIKCCAHTLNLIVRDGIAEVEVSISRIRQAVRYIRSSPQRAYYFNEYCEQEKVPHKSKLVLDVPTRWNYTYLMLETALKFKKVFEIMDYERDFSKDLPDGCPTEADWSRASTLCKFLKSFYDVTNRLSGSKYVTANSYFHDVFLIHKNLLTWAKDSEEKDLIEMTKSMQKKFDKYWGDMSKINMLLLLAVVLDPRFKLNYVKFCYGSIYDIRKVNELEKHIKDTLFRMYSCYELIDKKSKAKEGEGIVDIEVDQVINPPQKDGIQDMQDAYYRHLEAVNDGAKSEIERFLEETVEKKVGDFDILFWWKMNAHRFQILSLIAKDVLAIPVTTVASESAFSTAGRVLDTFRSSLSPKVVECLICAQDWLRAAPLPIDIDLDMSDIESTLTENTDLVGPSTLRE